MWTKTRWATFWAIFFTNPSGHPAFWLHGDPQDEDSEELRTRTGGLAQQQKTAMEAMRAMPTASSMATPLSPEKRAKLMPATTTISMADLGSMLRSLFPAIFSGFGMLYQETSGNPAQVT
jgi:hypothetical protein